MATAADPPPPDTPDTRPVATLAGPVGGDLLSGEFQVSITLTKQPLCQKMKFWLLLLVLDTFTAGSLSPASGEATAFRVRIQPFAGQETITVTVDDTRIKPHPTAGSITDSAPIGTVKSITGPTEFDGTTPFVVELTFAAAVPAGSLVEADLTVTGGSATDVQAKLGSDYSLSNPNHADGYCGCEGRVIRCWNGQV